MTLQKTSRRRVSLHTFFLFLLLLVPVKMVAATLYVAPGASCGGASPCYATIQEGVLNAINNDEIRVAEGTYSSVSTGDGITAVVRIKDKKLTLKGGYTTSNWSTSNPAANPTIIDANANGVGIFIKYQADIGIGHITIDGFSITDGSATASGSGTDSGGGVYIDHTTHVWVTIQNSKIYANYAEDGNGGGIWSAWSDNLNVTGNAIYDNAGSGVIATYGSNFVIVDNEIENNAGDGLKIISDSGKSDIHGNTISNNQGSGITLNTVLGGSVLNNVISGNQVTGGGGGIDVSGAVNDFLISKNTITGNSATVQGGGIDISGSVARITGNTIQSNTSGSNGGGGLYVNAGVSGAYVLVSGNQVLSNSTTNQGGGMLVLGAVDVTGNTITGNTAFSGGGIIATSKGSISDNVITGNSAKSGGGIRTVNPSGGLTIARNQVSENHATNGDGGGMNLWGGWYLDVALDANQVISNTATGKGGGVYIECPYESDPEADEPINISNTVLAKNIATTGSGLYSTICELNLAYSTIASNRDPMNPSHEGRGLYLRSSNETPSYNIENSIVADQAVGIYVESGSAAIASTLWGSGTWANDANTSGAGGIDIGTENYYGDPLFVDVSGDDYHIGKGSPAIDKGIDTWVSTDMDSQSRPSGASDLGADERSGFIISPILFLLLH